MGVAARMELLQRRCPGMRIMIPTHAGSGASAPLAHCTGAVSARLRCRHARSAPVWDDAEHPFVGGESSLVQGQLYGHVLNTLTTLLVRASLRDPSSFPPQEEGHREGASALHISCVPRESWAPLFMATLSSGARTGGRSARSSAALKAWSGRARCASKLLQPNVL